MRLVTSPQPRTRCLGLGLGCGGQRGAGVSWPHCPSFREQRGTPVVHSGALRSVLPGTCVQIQDPLPPRGLSRVSGQSGGNTVPRIRCPWQDRLGPGARLGGGAGRGVGHGPAPPEAGEGAEAEGWEPRAACRADRGRQAGGRARPFAMPTPPRPSSPAPPRPWAPRERLPAQPAEGRTGGHVATCRAWNVSATSEGGTGSQTPPSTPSPIRDHHVPPVGSGEHSQRRGGGRHAEGPSRTPT